MVTQDPNDQVYGTSSTLCDYVLRHQLQELAPGSIVDFGAGGGKIGHLVRDMLSTSCVLQAVEGYAPTAHHLTELGIYDTVHHALIQDWLKGRSLERYDMAIFGDVLEHLTPGEIHRALDACRVMFKEIVIQAPLCDLSQGSLHGNSLETHKTYLTAGFFDRYHPVEKHIVHGAEWTMMNVRITARPHPWHHHGAAQAVYHTSVLVLQFFGTAQPVVHFIRRVLRKAGLLK